MAGGRGDGEKKQERKQESVCEGELLTHLFMQTHYFCISSKSSFFLVGNLSACSVSYSS